MQRSGHARTHVFLRILMLLLTVTVLFFGVISFNQKTNQVTADNPFLAVEGDALVHVSYKSPEDLLEQSGLRYFFPRVLIKEKLQILLQIYGRGNQRNGRALTIYWSLQDYFQDRQILHYTLSRDQQPVETWQEEFTDYSRLFERIVEDIGVGGTLQINYMPTQEVETLNTTGRTFNYIIEPRPVSTPPAYYIQIAAAMMFLVVGFFIHFSRASKSSQLSEILYLTCLAFFGLLILNVTAPDGPMQWIIFWLFTTSMLFAPPLLLHFLHSMASEQWKRRRLDRWPFLYIPALLMLLLNIGAAVKYIAFEPVTPIGSKITLAESDLYSLVFNLNGFYFIGFVLLAMFTLYRIARQAVSPQAMQQIRWVFWGISLGLLPYVTVIYCLNPLLNLHSETMNLAVSIPLLVAPVSFGLTVLSRRFVDVDIIFKRGFIYFSSSFLLFALYIGLMFGLRSLSENITTETIVIISGGMILLSTLFSHRVKDYVQGFFDRFLYRDFFNFRKTLQRFSLELSYERNLETLLGRISSHINQHFSIDVILIFITSAKRENFVCSHSTVESFDVNYINTEDSERIKEKLSTNDQLFIDQFPDSDVQDALRNQGVMTVLPFVSLGEVIGFICLGSRQQGDTLNTDDLELLTSFTDRAGASIDNALLYMDIETRAEAMRILKEYNENLLESVDSGICAVDGKGKVQSWNSALENAFSIKRKEALGENILGLMPPRLANVLEPYLLGGSETGRFHTLYKVRVLNRANEEKIFNISFSPLGKLENGDPIELPGEESVDLPVSDTGEGTVLIFDDVTEGVSMEEKLQQQDKMAALGLLAAGVAHEVNTPLAGIAGYVQMLQRKIEESSDQHKILDKIDKQVFRASRIINNLLNFSRQGASTSEHIDLNALIKDSLLLTENQLKGREVNIELELEDDLREISGDRVKLQQVFVNLILNARDSLKGAGNITLSTSNRPDGTVECRVKDTGAGIPADALAKIFDPFFTTKKMGEGTGLGLSVSFGIIQEHNGDIQVESEVGTGTCFIITLPGHD